MKLTNALIAIGIIVTVYTCLLYYLLYTFRKTLRRMEEKFEQLQAMIVFAEGGIVKKEQDSDAS
jgi:hypothetical protein